MLLVLLRLKLMNNMKTVIIFSSESWFKVELIKEDSNMHFSAFKIITLDNDNIEDSKFEDISCVNGILRWDGKCTVSYQDIICGIHEIKQFYLLMQSIYNIQNDEEI